MFRVILIHHPPLSIPAHRFKWLTDAADLRAILAKSGAELIIHGHDHVHSLVWLEGPGRHIPALGVPSASAAPSSLHRAHQHAAYNLYRIDGTPGQWRCEAISRGYANGSGRIVELERRTLA